MVGGFFPTPYPDECLYSILCRYYARIGNATYEPMCELIFGKAQVLTSSVYFPIRLECVDNWAPPESGITRHSIAVNHTMYPYWAVTYKPEFRSKMEDLIDGKISSAKINRSAAIKIRRSWVKYLRYCPICSADDIATYGETYWHRKHQLQGSMYCLKHWIRLVDSEVSINDYAKTSFCPASSEVNTEYDVNIFDSFSDHKDKFLKIGQESEWLLENGLTVDWQTNGHDKYLKLFRDMGMASVHGSRCDYDAIDAAVNDYWGKDFLGVLLSEDFSGWLHQIQAWKMRSFTPIYHILLMCVVKGSVEKFVNGVVTDHPFGSEPYICENPICGHYHVDGAVLSEIRHFNSRAVGYFFCEYCGMRYKISKAKAVKGVTVITDYGHLWKNELLRCTQDKTITNEKTAEILKCDISVMMLQKKKLDLMRTPKYDIEMGPEAYYKSRVVALIEEYGEVTYSLLFKKIPGAYDYLENYHKEWLREHLTLRWETAERRVFVDYAQKKIQQAIAEIVANPPERQISYGYLAKITGLTRDNLRSLSRLHACVEGFVESREDWYRRRITTAYRSEPIKSRPYTTIEICYAASIEMKTYEKYREFFEEVVNELNGMKN